MQLKSKRTIHKRSFFCVITVLLNMFSFIAFAQSPVDVGDLKLLLNDSVSDVIVSINGDVWAVVGVDRQKIVRIKKNNTVREYLFGNEYKDIYITTLFPLPNGAVLAGTKSNYLFYIKGKSSVQIDHHNGLMDSTVLKIFINKQTDRLELTTPSCIYEIDNAKSARRIRFIPENEDDDVLVSFTNKVRQKIRKPIQKGISSVASEFDMSGRKKKYVGQTELDSVLKLVSPGDIFLKRDDYYLSNVGIEGFWTHSAIYLGSLDLLDIVFANHFPLQRYKPSELIKHNFPLIYQQMEGKTNLILEAIGKGVSINPIESIVFVDYVSAIRPNIPPADIFKSLLIAFEYLGVPYDFLFDFRSDDEVVCSELIYNAFRPRSDKEGLTFLFSEVMGLPFVSPNDFAHQFSNELESQKSSFSFVFFCDYDEDNKKPFFSTKEEFANSWKR